MWYIEFLRTWQNEQQDPKLHEADKQRNNKKPKEQKRAKYHYHLIRLARGTFQIKEERY